MAKRTEAKTKERAEAESAYLSSPDPIEGEACLAQALAEEGVPEEAAAKAASAFGDSLRVTQAAWRTKGSGTPEGSFREPEPISGLSADAKNLWFALIKQQKARPHPSNWIRLDKDLAKADSGLAKKADAFYEKAMNDLIAAGRVSLRVVVGKKESLPCFRINPEGDGK
jgi:hypothetical protein